MRRALFFQILFELALGLTDLLQLFVARFDLALQLSNSLELLLNFLVEVGFVLLLSLHMRLELLLDRGDFRVPLRESLGHRTFDVISLDSNLFAVISRLSRFGLQLGELLAQLGLDPRPFGIDALQLEPQLSANLLALANPLLERSDGGGAFLLGLAQPIFESLGVRLPLGELLIALGKGIDQLRPDLLQALPQLPSAGVAFLDGLIERLLLRLEFEHGGIELLLNLRFFRGAGLQLFLPAGQL